MFISVFKCPLGTMIPSTQHVYNRRPPKGSILHLNGVYLKDFYWSAKIVLALHFAHNRLFRSKSGHSSTIDKPNKNKGFNLFTHLKLNKTFFTFKSFPRPHSSELIRQVSLSQTASRPIAPLSPDFPFIRIHGIFTIPCSSPGPTLTPQVVREVFE